MNDDRPAVQYWRCPNCGQLHFGETPPDMCAFCQDFTTWQHLNPMELPHLLGLDDPPEEPHPKR
ncbi:MAG: hypothetical protein MUF87_18495 [Anaerolineae bacterium]|jgi:hypothetical protein|nr:hypothetical protein [Anaerolineae bacterium]